MHGHSLMQLYDHACMCIHCSIISTCTMCIQDIPLKESTIYADVSTKAMSTTCTMSLTALDDKVEYAELEYAELNYSADTTSHATRSTSMCPIR